MRWNIFGYALFSFKFSNKFICCHFIPSNWYTFWLPLLPYFTKIKQHLNQLIVPPSFASITQSLYYYWCSNSTAIFFLDYCEYHKQSSLQIPKTFAIYFAVEPLSSSFISTFCKIVKFTLFYCIFSMIHQIFHPWFAYYS